MSIYLPPLHNGNNTLVNCADYEWQNNSISYQTGDTRYTLLTNFNNNIQSIDTSLNTLQQENANVNTILDSYQSHFNIIDSSSNAYQSHFILHDTSLNYLQTQNTNINSHLTLHDTSLNFLQQKTNGITYDGTNTNFSNSIIGPTGSFSNINVSNNLISQGINVNNTLTNLQNEYDYLNGQILSLGASGAYYQYTQINQIDTSLNYMNKSVIVTTGATYNLYSYNCYVQIANNTTSLVLPSATANNYLIGGGQILVWNNNYSGNSCTITSPSGTFFGLFPNASSLVLPYKQWLTFQSDGTYWNVIENEVWTRDASSNNIYFNTGNVGIGTSSPSSVLDVNGNIHGSNSLTVDGSLYINGVGQDVNSHLLQIDSSCNAFQSHFNTIDSSCNTFQSHFNTIDSSCNVFQSHLNIIDSSCNAYQSHFTLNDASLNYLQTQTTNINSHLTLHDTSLNFLQQKTNGFTYDGTNTNFSSPIIGPTGSFTNINISNNLISQGVNVNNTLTNLQNEYDYLNGQILSIGASGIYFQYTQINQIDTSLNYMNQSVIITTGATFYLYSYNCYVQISNNTTSVVLPSANISANNYLIGGGTIILWNNNYSGNSVTITNSAGSLFFGSFSQNLTSVLLPYKQWLTFQSDGTNWNVKEDSLFVRDPSSNNIYYNTGNVGINTLTPTHTLDVNGSIYSSGNLYINNNSQDVNSHLSSIDSSCNKYESHLSSIDSSCNKYESHLSSIDSSCNKYESHLSSIDSSCNTFQSHLSSIDSSCNTFQSHLSSIDISLNYMNKQVLLTTSNPFYVYSYNCFVEIIGSTTSVIIPNPTLSNSTYLSGGATIIIWNNNYSSNSCTITCSNNSTFFGLFPNTTSIMLPYKQFLTIMSDSGSWIVIENQLWTRNSASYDIYYNIGNVGIGKNPTYNLDVSGNIASSNNIIAGKQLLVNGLTSSNYNLDVSGNIHCNNLVVDGSNNSITEFNNQVHFNQNTYFGNSTGSAILVNPTPSNIVQTIYSQVYSGTNDILLATMLIPKENYVSFYYTTTLDFYKFCSNYHLRLGSIVQATNTLSVVTFSLYNNGTFYKSFNVNASYTFPWYGFGSSGTNSQIANGVTSLPYFQVFEGYLDVDTTFSIYASCTESGTNQYLTTNSAGSYSMTVAGSHFLFNSSTNPSSFFFNYGSGNGSQYTGGAIQTYLMNAEGINTNYLSCSDGNITCTNLTPTYIYPKYPINYSLSTYKQMTQIGYTFNCNLNTGGSVTTLTFPSKGFYLGMITTGNFSLPQYVCSFYALVSDTYPTMTQTIILGFDSNWVLNPTSLALQIAVNCNYSTATSFLFLVNQFI